MVNIFRTIKPFRCQAVPNNAFQFAASLLRPCMTGCHPAQQTDSTKRT